MAKLKFPEIYKWHGFTVNYTILGFIVVLIAFLIVMNSLNKDDAPEEECEGEMIKHDFFTSFGVKGGSGPCDPAPQFMGIKIDNWGAWTCFMFGLTLMAFFEQWRFSTVARLKNHLKDSKHSYETFLKSINAKSGTRKAILKLALFKMTDGLIGAILKVLPIIVVTEARQLQYSFPMFLVDIVMGTKAILEQVELKYDHPKQLEQQGSAVAAQKTLKKLQNVLNTHKFE